MKTTALLSLLFFYCLYPLTALALDNVQVKAVVPAKSSDFTVSVATSDTTNPVGKNHVIPFTISYSNNLSYATPLSIKASWSRGTIQGDSNPSVTIAHYLDSSATLGYGNTVPFIDTINRTITWNVNSLPGNSTSYEVNFSLLTSSSYTNDSPVTFTVTPSLNGPGTLTPGNTVARQFLSENTLVPTSTPTPASINPTSAPSQALPATINQLPFTTPTAAIASLPTIENILIQSVSSDQASVSVLLDKQAGVTLSYGLSPTSLRNQFSSNNPARFHEFNLENLVKRTKYYFKVNSGSTESDIYTFTTSEDDSFSLDLIKSFVVTSNDVILSANSETITSSKSAITPVALLPAQSLYEFRFSISNSVNIKSIEAFLRNRSILGANSDGILQTELVELIETSPGIFLGKLKAPETPGIYELFLRVGDKKGNVIERSVSVLSISKPFSVLSKKTNEPIEGAEVTFYIFNTKTKKYDKIKSVTISILNPSYTDTKGQISNAFPTGKYKAVIETLNYKEKEVLFSVGQNITDSYPQVLLEEGSISIFSLSTYFFDSISKIFISSTSTYFSSLASSQRTIHVLAFITLVSLLFITLYSASKRMQLSFFSLPLYLLHHLRNKVHETTMLSGTILDHSDSPVMHANIYLIDSNTNKIIAHNISNGSGFFKLAAPEGNYRISVLKEGYHPFTIFENLPLKHSLALSIVKNDEKQSLLGRLEEVSGFILERSFEFILFGSLILMCAISLKTAWVDTLPFLLAAFLNVYLWYEHHRKREITLSKES